MVYTLSFFKNFRSNSHYTINVDIINKLVEISKNLNKGVLLKITTDKCVDYVFQKLKVTKVVQKTLTWNEQMIIDIKSLLNKLSGENIAAISLKISELIETADESIFQLIFDISYKNKFFSKNYSMLVIDLCDKNSSFKDFILKNIDKLYTLYNDMNYVSPNANYNEYCENVKKTEERSSYGCFYANLCANEFIEVSVMEMFLRYLLETISQLMDTESHSHEVEEIIDNIHAILMILKISIDLTLIQTISKSTNKTYKSVTNKSIFKCMDIMDLMVK